MSTCTETIFAAKPADDLPISAKTKGALWAGIASWFCSLFFFLFLLYVLQSERHLSPEEEALQFFVGVALFVTFLLGCFGMYRLYNGDYRIAAPLFGADGILVLVLSIAASSTDAFEDDHTQSVLMCFAIVALALNILYIALQILGAKDTATITQNVSQCYLKMDENAMCGISFSDITQPNNGKYFEVYYTDFRYAEIDSENICDLLIHHKSGTHRLCLEDAQAAKLAIEGHAAHSARE